MTGKSVFPKGHEPDSTKRRGSEDQDLLSNERGGHNHGKSLTAEQRLQEERAKGHDKGHFVGVDGNTEIPDPPKDRGAEKQRGYGKNQDKEQERKTAKNRANGANEGRISGN